MLSFKEMQLLAEKEFSVEAAREDLKAIVEFFKSRKYYMECVDVAFVKERQLPWSTAEEHDVFFVDEDTLVEDIPEDLRHESLGMVKGRRVVYAGRIVYPVKDVKGQVMGFCGWDKFEKPKYIDSKNNGYKAKDTTFYGMEKMAEYYKSSKPVYVVEGIVCCLYLRSIGLQSVALLTSSLSPYVVEILKRIQNRVVIIPDNDIIGKDREELQGLRPAGEHLVRLAKKYLTGARVIQPAVAKDVDDTRKVDNHKYEEQFKQELASVAVNPYRVYRTIRVR